MMRSPEYAVADRHRTNGLERHLILATSESHNRIDEVG